MSNITEFKVLNLGDLISDFGAIWLCEKKLSDHNMIFCQMRVSSPSRQMRETVTTDVTCEREEQCVSQQGKDKFDKPPRKFKNTNLPSEFMNTKEVSTMCRSDRLSVEPANGPTGSRPDI